MAQVGHQITLIVADGLPIERIKEVEIRSVPRCRGRISRMFFTTWRVYREARRVHADLYHLHDPELIGVGLVLRAWGSRVVFDAHEDLPKQVLHKPYLPTWTRPIVGIMVQKFLKLCLPCFSGLIGAEPLIADWLRSFHPRTVEVKNFPIINEISMRAVNPRRGPFHSVCYIGALSRARGIVELAKAVVDFPEGIDLVLAGEFEDELLWKEIQGMPSSARIHYLGVLDRDGVQRVLAESLAGMAVLHPTPKYTEAYPTKLFEYWSAGLPVIISDFPLWRQLAGNGKYGIFVDPMDPLAIAGAVRWLCDNPELAQEMGQRCREVVLAKYSWEDEARRLVSFVEELNK
ncbi:MAG: glycosyltransferase [Alphaproteobacteria bacterium]|nr:glycosyltransferase [Alphaproteobacteria bacterium]